jgi:hypothetical protein
MRNSHGRASSTSSSWSAISPPHSASTAPPTSDRDHLRFCNPDVDDVLLEDAHGRRGLILLRGDVIPILSSPEWAPMVVQVDDLDAALPEPDR